jgi:hypothetical protein
MTRAASLILSALISVSAAGPALAQSQPAEPSESPAVTDPGPRSFTVTPRDTTAGQMTPKQMKKMGRAGKKRSRHHGKPGPAGSAPQGDGNSEGQPAQPQ